MLTVKVLHQSCGDTHNTSTVPCHHLAFHCPPCKLTNCADPMVHSRPVSADRSGYKCGSRGRTLALAKQLHFRRSTVFIRRGREVNQSHCDEQRHMIDVLMRRKERTMAVSKARPLLPRLGAESSSLNIDHDVVSTADSLWLHFLKPPACLHTER